MEFLTFLRCVFAVFYTDTMNESPLHSKWIKLVAYPTNYFLNKN